jgi:hypothetical protein
VTMDEAIQKYHKDPRFYRLVTYLKQAVWSGVLTPDEVLTAVELVGFLVKEKRKQTRYSGETQS